ncbi:CxC ATPase DNA modification system associated small protein [Vibrio tapetis]|uniref:Uncharacterized protein n=1 Tax=Vibrio tapetis subsp. tapetis TaxID=1671868 RepID=A0A2N8Z9D9_9VIBR|nr:CxC ATPase DNA modification system associated small protein [Vibrio tapetis]SON48535.1 protein of unknown function [Vibrio tapetis subsp. tapetis]
MLDFEELKAQLKEIDQQTNSADEIFKKRSTTHKVAAQIMDMERQNYYQGNRTHDHLMSIRNMIEKNVEEICKDEIN